MDTSFAKVFRSMYTGSMYGAGMHVFAVWGWILAHADENGMVEINPSVVADQLGKGGATVAQQVRNAIAYLLEPDPNSRSTEEEGRRIVHVEAFIYRVVNKNKYRDKGANRAKYWREYKRAQRAKSNVSTVDNVDKCGQSTNSTQEEVETEVEVKKKKPPIVPHRDDLFDRFWKAYPRKVGKDAALKAFKRRKVDEELLITMLAAIEAQKHSECWCKDGGKFIPHPTTWINQGRWQDVVETARDTEELNFDLVTHPLNEEEEYDHCLLMGWEPIGLEHIAARRKAQAEGSKT